MNDEAVKTMFEALAHIMNQNQRIERHLGISKCDSEWGWDDRYTDELVDNCNYMARMYNHDD